MPNALDKERIYLYDSLLRDGAQTRGVDFSAVDKQELSQHLDALGLDYIEGGFPGANPTDDAFFADLPNLKNSKMVAFGMTRRASTSAENDPGLNALVNSGVAAACIVGKASAFHVEEALGIALEENIKIVSESVAYLASKGLEVMLDAEHFFDGYKENAEYALNVAKAAFDAGARWVVLCDTNGGTLPHEVEEIVAAVTKQIPGENLGIHCHNDTENAVANSLAAVRAGARQVQGTLNGYGERCGNANLVSLIPNLKIKMGFHVGISDSNLNKLTQISNALDDRLNRPRYKHAAYVGSSAFAHKGGLHVSAVMKNPAAYEHVAPEAVGNERMILVSDQAGRSNIINRINKMGLNVEPDSKEVSELVNIVKEHEAQGYSYDGADASFELLTRKKLGQVPDFYNVRAFRVIDERRWNAKGELVTFSEAKVRVMKDGERQIELAEGNGPVDALYKALVKALSAEYPVLKNLAIKDYKVRIIQPERASAAITRVQIEMEDASSGKRWVTLGVSGNIIDASFNALDDAFCYYLLGER